MGDLASDENAEMIQFIPMPSQQISCSHWGLFAATTNELGMLMSDNLGHLQLNPYGRFTD